MNTQITATHSTKIAAAIAKTIFMEISLKSDKVISKEPEGPVFLSLTGATPLMRRRGCAVGAPSAGTASADDTVMKRHSALVMSAQLRSSPVKMRRICSMVRLFTAFSLLTMTAMPSFAMTRGVSPFSISLCLTSREAMPS